MLYTSYLVELYGTYTLSHLQQLNFQVLQNIEILEHLVLYMYKLLKSVVCTKKIFWHNEKIYTIPAKWQFSDFCV